MKKWKIICKIYRKKVSKEKGEWQRKKISEEEKWHEKESRKLYIELSLFPFLNQLPIH